MEYKLRIKAIRERATRIGIPIRDLLAVAKVSASTLFRWEQDDANPRMRSMFRALGAMEAELDRRERSLVEQLLKGVA